MKVHLHLQDGETFADIEGMEVPDLAAAEVEAIRLLAGVLADRPADIWQDRTITVMIQDEAGLTLGLLMASATRSTAIAANSGR